MHPRVREVLDCLDTSHAELKRALAQVPQAERATRPAPDRWSSAEVVEHLAIVEGRIAGLLGGALAGATGDETETTPVSHTLPSDRIRDRSAPIVASEASQPKGQMGPEEALAALEAQRRTIREALVAANGRALGAIRVPHPRFGELDVYQWVLFVGAHEQRHADQIREIAEAFRGRVS